MKHRSQKAKFGEGYDANKMLFRKLVENFFLHNTLTTTKQRAKAVQPLVERLVTKAKSGKQADINYLLRHITNKTVLATLTKEIAPAMSKVVGGYTKVLNRGQRMSDGSLEATLSWAHPIVKKVKEATQKKEEKKTVQTPEKKAVVTT